MYRLFNIGSNKLTRFNNLSVSTCNVCTVVKNAGEIPLCKQTASYFRACRFQSTGRFTSFVTKSSKKKKKQHNGTTQYADVLVVSDSSTVHHKAKIKNLTPEDLKFLATTNLNLSELYKLKDMMKFPRVVETHTYSNLSVIGNISSKIEDNDECLENAVEIAETVIPVDLSSDLSESAAEETVSNESVGRIHHLSSFQPETLEDSEVEETHIREEPSRSNPQQSQNQKQDATCRLLASYAEICNSLNNTQKGLNAFWYQLHSPYKAGRSIKSIHVYNTLLKGLAAQGHFAKVEAILKISKEQGVSFDLQTYSSVFECLGRVSNNENNSENISSYIDEFQKRFSFDDIFNKVSFFADQKKMVLKVLQEYDKNYVPCYSPPDVQYSNRLVEKLNHSSQLEPYVSNRGAKNKKIFTKEMLQKNIQKQLDVEKVGYITVRNIAAVENPTSDIIKYRGFFQDHIKLWEEAALQAFNRDLAALVARQHSFNMDCYMRCIPKKDYINIIVEEAKLLANGSETYSPTVQQLYKAMGSKVYARYLVLQKSKTGAMDKIVQVHQRYCQDFLDKSDDSVANCVEMLNSRQKWQWIEHQLKGHGSSINIYHQPWTPFILHTVGKFLYSIIMHDLKIDVNIFKTTNKHKNYFPAFYTIFRHQGHATKEEVKPHPILSKLCKASSLETLTFPSYESPMKCPPIPWCYLNTGGYLVTHTDVVRLPPQALSQMERLKETPANKLYPVFDALNQLGAVPWRINKPILDCILKVFKSGGSAKLNVPESPSSIPKPPSPTDTMDKQQKFMIFRQRLQYYRKKSEMYSLWCDCLYKLSLANHFKHDVFWLPHNMDFRGRVYPVPPHLSHLGSDLARSMLVFAESRRLGPDGLRWLKIHAINLTGLKKRDSIEERLAYADKILDKILDSADNPLEGKMWWADSEEPWQTLACCMEIAAALRSPDPAKYRSCFPVHQDGSCNGLQHYAALGRDLDGGFSVNLTPAERPQDVYSAVVTLVEQQRQKDVKSGLEVAKILEGFVTRKVIKQTIMTTVYGVTKYGARQQIAKQLKNIDTFPKNHIWWASSYLATRTFESLRTMFTSTKEIQDWFTECAGIITSLCQKNIEWKTPLDFPIVQPYLKKKRSQDSKQFITDIFGEPNSAKHKNAFPPNFIHSLDSSHMMLTSLYCERAGITYVSVHDCFWTHPSTVHIMNKICREQFVALHSGFILEELSAFFCDKFGYIEPQRKGITKHQREMLMKVLQRIPKTGKLDVTQVLNSLYFFS